MPKTIITESLSKLKEEFSSAWTLLNDTSRYLKHAGLFHEYENMLRQWRSALHKRYRNTDTYREIKRQIIDLRTGLREQGHELRLGSMDITMKGFKSDNAPKYGYRRAVLYLAPDDITFLTGEENHIDLGRFLERRMGTYKKMDFSYLHNIWFRWRGNILEIAGSDSETKDQYEIMDRYIETRKMFVLKRCKGMR